MVLRGFTKERALAEFKNIGSSRTIRNFVQLRAFSD